MGRKLQLLATVGSLLLAGMAAAATPNFTSAPLNISSAIPSGWVAAFDRSSCPSGWSHFSLANGRAIIGRGRYTESRFGSWSYTYSLRQRTGSVLNRLSTLQLPAHSHSFTVVNETCSDRSSVCNSNRGSGLIVGGGYYPSTKTTSSQGSGRAFDQRTPTIALTYCRKN